MAGIQQQAYGIQLDDFLRFRSGNDPAVSAFYLCHKVSLLPLRFRLLFCQNAADHLGGLIESLIIRIHRHLRDDGGDISVNTTAKKLCAESILNIIADIPLAHGGADGHRSTRVFRVRLSKFIHCRMNHADLRTVAVRNHDIRPVCNQIRDSPDCLCDRLPLLRESRTQRRVSQGNYHTFFLHLQHLAS